jgi:hypothetical protein
MEFARVVAIIRSVAASAINVCSRVLSSSPATAASTMPRAGSVVALWRASRSHVHRSNCEAIRAPSCLYSFLCLFR